MSKAYYDDVRKRGEEMERLRAENSLMRMKLEAIEDGLSHDAIEVSDAVRFAREALQQPSQAYERYQAMQKVCDEARRYIDADGSAPVKRLIDALEALDQ